MRATLRILIGSTLALFLAATSLAQALQSGSAAPTLVPPQITSAHTIFVSNGGGPNYFNAFTGGPDRATVSSTPHCSSGADTRSSTLHRKPISSSRFAPSRPPSMSRTLKEPARSPTTLSSSFAFSIRKPAPYSGPQPRIFAPPVVKHPATKASINWSPFWSIASVNSPSNSSMQRRSRPFTQTPA